LAKRQVCVAKSVWRGHEGLPKGNRIRYVPLTHRAAAALHAYRHLRGPLVLYRKDGRPMPEYTLRDLLLRVGRLANLRHSGPHMLRHTFCSHLIMRGALVTAVKELAGHRDISTTMRYIHLAPSVLTDAIALLNGRDVSLPRGDNGETALG
jgi:site-specific recombinase XerD